MTVVTVQSVPFEFLNYIQRLYSGEFNFAIFSARITVQNSVNNYLCNSFFFLQISVLLVAVAMDSKPGQVEDPLDP